MSGIEGIAYIDNRPVFKDALKRGPYEKYFTDHFAQTWGRDPWGHCTAEGNQLIAENAARGLAEPIAAVMPLLKARR
ncbi:MAG TPA: hypothetical protein VH309_14785 [Elusimicrobiota bacterium]|nr:hypothetical protein [Elusimicrobiota bacterium]